MKSTRISQIVVLSVLGVCFLISGCSDHDDSPSGPGELEHLVIESVTKHPTSSDMCALSVTIQNLLDQAQYLALDYDCLDTGSDNKRAFAVVYGTLPPSAVQTFEATIHPFFPSLEYRSISCAIDNFQLNALSAVFSEPPSDSERGLDKLIIESAENVQTSRVCRLRLLLESIPSRSVDILLNYEAFDNAGNKIATATFPVILYSGGITLEHTWTQEENSSSLENCADIASFGLTSSSFVF